MHQCDVVAWPDSNDHYVVLNVADNMVNVKVTIGVDYWLKIVPFPKLYVVYVKYVHIFVLY